MSNEKRATRYAIRDRRVSFETEIVPLREQFPREILPYGFGEEARKDTRRYNDIKGRNQKYKFRKRTDI